MTNDGLADELNPQLLDHIVKQQIGLKSRLSGTGAKTLAQQILKQVAAKHASTPNNPTLLPPPDQIEAFALLLLDEEEDAGSVFVSRLREAGFSKKEIYLSYLAEAARLLGKWWDEDRVSFAEVTIGASRIYGILRIMDDVYVPRKTNRSKRALFVVPESENHSLGINMASDVLRQKGWQIEMLLGEPEAQVLNRIQEANHVIVGLSSAGTHSVTELAKLVLAIRIHHPDVFILISGQVLNEMHDTVEAMQPDALESDFDSALMKLEEFWSRVNGIGVQFSDRLV